MAERCAPIFLIAGGRGMRVEKGPDPLLQAVFRRTGVRRPTVAYVGAASGDDAAFRLSNVTRFQEAGAGKVTLAPLCGKSGNTGRAKAVLDASDLVFLSGGDVEEGMQVLKEKGMTDFLRCLYRAGKPFFGISAGSIMLARQWIRWRDSDDEEPLNSSTVSGLLPFSATPTARLKAGRNCRPSSHSLRSTPSVTASLQEQPSSSSRMAPFSHSVERCIGSKSGLRGRAG